MPRKILIVDDDDSTRSGLRQFLERAGFDVIAVSSYGEGRFALTELHPDLLIADVRLGEFNGLQLVATNPRAIPAIIITGYADTVLEADAHRLGADYLVKPVSPTSLMNLVRQKLAPQAEGTPIFSPSRRWERKQVSGELPARVGDAPARILDISYGGLRFQVDRGSYPLPHSFMVNLPSSGLSIPVDLVWSTRSDEERWVCGAAIAEDESDSARAWHGLVDDIA